jgi:hypothetical protein
MAQHVPRLPWHLPMLHPVPAACAFLHARNSGEGPARPRRCADAVVRA